MSEITAFISYSHDSEAHGNRVLALSERLRSDGIATILDRYVDSPPEGWPRWMMNGLNGASHVICVCSTIYLRRFLGLEVPDQGRGADFEGALITQQLYDARSRSNKFVPVIFDRNDEPNIPDPLRGQTHYLVGDEPSYRRLCDALLGQGHVIPGNVEESKPAKPSNYGGASSTAPRGVSSTSQGALKIWREKLEFLLVEDAVSVDPGMKFRINHLIKESRGKILSLGGEQ